LASRYFTEHLQYPIGISLARRTLSPFDSILGGMLGWVIGPHPGFNLLLFVHFALGGWAMFQLFGFGETLLIAGKDSGIPVPYKLLEELSVASMLRKPDRFFVVVQLTVAAAGALA